MRDEQEMIRRGGVAGPLPQQYRPALAAELAEAVEMYNVMGGIDWAALPLMFELYNIRDPQRAITRLAIIRDAVAAPRQDGSD